MHRSIRRPLLLALACTATVALAQADTPQSRLKAAFGGAALDAIARFDYRLNVTDAQGKTLREGQYVLLPASRRLHVRDTLATDRTEAWSGDDGSWRLVGTQWEFLGPAPAAPYRQHVAYHFLPLLRDPATRYQALSGDRLRLSPAGAASFEVRLDPVSGRIIENRFDGGTTARELDYRDVGGLRWPMVFEVVESGAVVRHGRFSEASVSTQAALPAMPMEEAGHSLPPAQADVARLVGAGWLSGTDNDYNLSLDAREERLVFARSQPHFEHAHILMSRRDGARWTPPQPVPFSDPRFSDSDPWLTPDGHTLYFVSNRPLQGDAPRKDLEVWRVAIGDDGFGPPEHLAALSSEGQELGPELHDGWLYFNSTRSGGPARMSIYRARMDGARIGAPQPLDAPFNVGTLQGDFTLSPDGRIALFWSQRDGSTDGDLFAVRRDGTGWSKAVRLPSPINAIGFDFTPSFSADGRTLRLASMRKPAWLDESGHVFNGQSNVYVVPASLVDGAFEPDPKP